MASPASIPTAPYDRRAIQDALHDWFSSTTGLGSDRVWWAGQDVVETEWPFGTLSWLSTSPVGVDGDGTTALFSNDALPVDTPDVRLHAEGWRIVTIAVAAFSDPRGQPEMDAFSMVDSAIAKLRLTTVRGALQAAGIGILSTTGTSLVAPGHATAQMTLLITSSVFEDVFSIQGVRVLSDDDSEVVVDVIAPDGFSPPG